MRVTHIVVATIAVSVVTPVAAEYPIWTHFYITQDSLTKKCVVVDSKPTPNGIYSVAYESRTLAEGALSRASKEELETCSIRK
jgi:hypothetical protein